LAISISFRTHVGISQIVYRTVSIRSGESFTVDLRISTNRSHHMHRHEKPVGALLYRPTKCVVCVRSSPAMPRKLSASVFTRATP